MNVGFSKRGIWNVRHESESPHQSPVTCPSLAKLIMFNNCLQLLVRILSSKCGCVFAWRRRRHDGRRRRRFGRAIATRHSGVLCDSDACDDDSHRDFTSCGITDDSSEASCIMTEVGSKIIHLGIHPYRLLGAAISSCRRHQ